MSKNNATFEEKLARLEQIVQAMEKGDVPLEESLKLFQEGTSLVGEGGTLLEEAEQQVTKIVTQLDGSPAEEAFGDGNEL